MQHLELQPPVGMRDRIQGFWYLERDFGPEPSAFEVLPDGNAEVIFYFGTELTLEQGGQRELMPSPFIVGLLGKTVQFYAKDRLKIIGVKCYPWAVYELLNLTPIKDGLASSLSHPIVSLQHELAALLEQEKIAEGLNLVSDWFVEQQSLLADNPLLAKAGKAMLQSKGSLPVTAVAEAAHATVRTLERKFKASSGHTVKDVAVLMRFEQVRDRLCCAPDTPIAGLAHELGYADQSHLNREFKRYSGMTAAAFARQATVRQASFADDFVAIVLSSQV